jgi:SAM-dependent methyltransferase
MTRPNLRPDVSPDDFEQFYDRIAKDQLEERYIVTYWYSLARFYLVLGLLRPFAEDGSHLLEVGCASGYYATAYARAGGRVTGIDISSAGVQTAARRAGEARVGDRCRFVKADMRKLPFPDDEFDAVVMTEVLEHVREQRLALSEALRVLRPGGALFLTTPHAFDELPWWRRLRHRNAQTPEAAGVAIERLGRNEIVAAAGIEHEPYFHDAFTYSQLRELMPPNGSVVELRSLYFMPPGLTLGASLPRPLRRLARRLLSSAQGSTRIDDTTSPARSVDDEIPIELPQLEGLALLMVVFSRLCWRIPFVRRVGRHNLLIARRL